MTTLTAMVQLKAAKDGLSQFDMLRRAPELTRSCRATLRECGMKDEEIDADYPRQVVVETVALIRNDPWEFKRQAEKAHQWMIGRN